MPRATSGHSRCSTSSGATCPRRLACGRRAETPRQGGTRGAKAPWPPRPGVRLGVRLRRAPLGPQGCRGDPEAWAGGTKGGGGGRGARAAPDGRQTLSEVLATRLGGARPRPAGAGMLDLMGNPGLIELTRGALVESCHRGALALARADGVLCAALGDVARPIFPRSAVKPLQAIAFAASGAIERFGLGSPELAIACGSHAGTRRHAAVVEAMLSRAGLTPAALACGQHTPMDPAAARELIVTGAAASPLQHNCSGKHAGMLLGAVVGGEPIAGYWRADHPVQVRIREDLEALTGCRLGREVMGIDGCCVPTWALPLTGLATAFARLPFGAGLAGARAQACRRLVRACWEEPELVAGLGRLDTGILRGFVGEVLIKSGAEGVYCGALPARGLGFALKVDDGAKRAAEALAVALLARFYPAAKGLGPAMQLKNWRGLDVGWVRLSAELEESLARLP